MTPRPARTDAALVELARAGDAQAFSELFARHRASVARLCAQRLSSGDVDDAVQEAFAHALGRLVQLRDPARFGPWIRSIAVRTCADHHRATRRIIVLDDGEAGEIPDAAPTPDEVVEDREHAAALRATMSELGERDRQALWLRHVADAPVAAVATELGLTEGSTRVLLTRARHRLRAAVTSLPVFVPLSWRQWLRDHMPASGPAVEALAVAMLVTVAVGGGRSLPEPATPQPATVPGIRVVAEVEPAKSQQPARSTGREAATSDFTAGNTAAPAESRQARVAPAASKRRGPLTRARNSVDVRDRYPDDAEAEEVVDVTFYANGEETGTRLYADDVNDAIGATKGALGE